MSILQSMLAFSGFAHYPIVSPLHLLAFEFFELNKVLMIEISQGSAESSYSLQKNEKKLYTSIHRRGICCSLSFGFFGWLVD